MTEEKTRRLIIASTVGAVLLLFVLLSVMIYGLVAIRLENKEKLELENKIAEYNRLIEEGEDTLEVRSMRAWIEMRARELGYVFDSDVPLS